jgi:NAD(P)-dependent dehydrogenase (short-subunit alcohol dehydrogenase family)
MDLFDLKDRVAIVVGGAGDFGTVACQTYADYGATVVVADQKAKEAEILSSKLREQGRRSTALEVDATDKASCHRMTTLVLEKYKKIDILFVTHGTALRDPALEIEEEEWERVLRVNLKGVFLLCQAVGKTMVQQRKGNIILMASLAAFMGVRNISAYSASKAGVVQLTKVLAAEWAGYNVHVNAIAPTYFLTGHTRDFLSDKERYNQIVKTIPLGRMGKPEEIAALALFLASDKAVSMITGQTFLIDGGQAAILPLF